MGVPVKKRPRAAAGPAARCQVPGCEADISELKGYHRRHRVCLRCANASTVVLDGLSKRYCQQCGKFHILSDFDEGKRSCRRKLERHNNRRRRKPSESKVAVEKDPQGLVLADDVARDDENEKDSTCLSSQLTEREPLLESEEGQISTLCSNPSSQNIQSDSVASFVVSREPQIDGEKDESKHAHSSFYCDNKSAYSSLCPTGRISFKLYDWNPAEFPRRLRHQVFTGLLLQYFNGCPACLLSWRVISILVVQSRLRSLQCRILCGLREARRSRDIANLTPRTCRIYT